MRFIYQFTYIAYFYFILLSLFCYLKYKKLLQVSKIQAQLESIRPSL